ncbi:RelA/SpoT family protein [Oceanibacterium hippocampi]|uniref:GTP pyrophosphokinase rsh n=1 Tax=Oceanibacterium hippocampi TaxID=745714 RepID=A0A1Y5TZ91_9PROT|nr:bifunctional (p)ppGpp synthetase/guanosine-3',5'-bis(diphosphate) 3'-pyrophosphohydrolase [Oceanibacterium hippocampi]SLN77079.1 GTP pyrophosphokinase rsh [Oceanibacterium hippocampi]
MLRQVELVDRVLAYDPDADEDLLHRAYVFTVRAHGSQLRDSGDPYFSHPIEVAGILTGLKLDTATIVTALLHDTIEDTVATREEVAAKFGEEVATLVDGVTKLSQLELQSDRTKQAENFRKLLIAMSNDIRVLLVKLADRLHNMRTLHFIERPEKRHRIALETMEIYAPLAERIGMQSMKDELEDLAFAELNPDARASVQKRLSYLREEGADVVSRISQQLTETLARYGVKAIVNGREKRPFSIWRKMERKNVSFEQLSDIIAFRVIVANIAECYQALGVFHSHFKMVPDRFKDYISTPKRNGYQSLHTSVIGPEKQRIEIQIRSQAMHEIAELGVAAHWQYKQGVETGEGRDYRWLRELLEILEHASDPEEFLEHTKLSMFQDQVFCFTPKGDLIALPAGATPVDFAYAVHTGVGDTCVGAKVNQRMTPLRTILRNGDQVEILRSKNQTPSPTWENFVVSGKARSAIRRFTRNRQRVEYHELGKAIAEKILREAGQTLTERAIQEAVRFFKCDKSDDLYVALGEGTLTPRQVKDVLFPEAAKPDDNVVPLARARTDRKSKHRHSVPIRGLIPGMAVHFAGCCHPLPGDRIVGIVSTGRGVTVHTIECETLEQYAETPERWLDVSWSPDSSPEDYHIGRITTVIANEPGALSSLTTVIAKNGGNINNLKITSRSLEFFEMIIDIQVRDVRHLTNIIAALRADPVVSSVDRASG